MFKATFPEARYILDLFKAINAVAEEACFRITPEAIAVKAVDPSVMALVDFRLEKNASEEWVLDGHEELKMSVSVSEMLRIIGGAKSGEALTIAYDPEEKKVRFILLEATGSRKRDIYLNTLEEFEGKDVTPKVEFKAMASITTKALREAVEDCRLFNDVLKIRIDSEVVELSARSDEGNALIRFPKYSSLIYELEAEQETASHYSILYLSKMLKAGLSLSDSTRIDLAKDKPMKIGFEIPYGKLDYYLAPYIRS